MNSLGILSAYSAYSAAANSVYDSTSTLPIKSTQDSSAEVSTEDTQVDDLSDVAIISDKAKALSAADNSTLQGETTTTNLLSKSDSSSTSSSTASADSSTSGTESKSGEKLTPAQEQQVRELKARDAQVKAHEEAHIAASAGISASAPTYTYQTGPDGVQYAIGGEVNISFSQGSDPETNLANAEAMKAAALAPADPSSQDLSVANNADKMIQEAKQEIAAERDDSTGTGDKSGVTDTIVTTGDSKNTDSNKTVGSNASSDGNVLASSISS